ncbi:response regulator transcription factor [Nocardioides sp.]|uniref:response regulator transcription factor n=1 Tax=Nocardioides sp. TaxID=35761 RepID=UPI0039E296FB
MIRVATVDNHEIVRDGVVGRLAGSAPEIGVVSSTANVQELFDSLAAGIEVDVVLLDLHLQGCDSTAWIPTLVERGMRVLLYTTEERPVPLRQAMRAGICGLVLKSDPAGAIVDAIWATEDEGFYCSGTLAHVLLTDEMILADLSPRQSEILRLLEEGLDYRAVASLLGFSEGALKTHLSRVRDKFRKIGVEPRNTHHIIRLARDQGHLT